MKDLDEITKVNEQQISFANRLGLDISGCTIREAFAKIQDILDIYFWSNSDLGHPSNKQIELAAKFGFDISDKTLRIANAIIDDIMEQLNLESIENQSLKPGDTVHNIWDKFHQGWIISSIHESGLVFFKGGNGKKAWARNLVKIEKTKG